MNKDEKDLVKGKIHNFKSDFVFDTSKVSIELCTPDNKEVRVWLRGTYFISKDEHQEVKDAFTNAFQD